MHNIQVTCSVNNDKIMRKIQILLITMVNIIFVTLKLIHVSYVFFHAEFKYVIRTGLSPTNFVWQNFLKCNFSKFGLFVMQSVCFTYAEALYYIVITVWPWELNNYKCRMHVSPITDSQSVQAQMYWHVSTWNKQ